MCVGLANKIFWLAEPVGLLGGQSDQSTLLARANGSSPCWASFSGWLLGTLPAPAPAPAPAPSPAPSPAPEEDKDAELWWGKIEPLLSIFRAACKRYYIPGTEVAIDEIMVRFHGRLADTYKMLNKPIKQGYKIFALADNGYVWWFQLSSRRYGIAELDKHKDLTATGSMVLQMARLLPKID